MQTTKNHVVCMRISCYINVHVDVDVRYGAKHIASVHEYINIHV